MTYLRHTEHVIAARQSKQMLANAAASANARALAAKDCNLVSHAVGGVILGLVLAVLVFAV